MHNAKIHNQRKSTARRTSVNSVQAPAPQCGCDDHTVARGDPCRRKRLSVQYRVIGRTAPESVPPIVYDDPTSPGQFLDAKTRAFIGSRFGYDSVITLGRVGNDRLYVLQETVPINPDYIN